MNTAFTRLVWKEYRAQRILWMALLLGWMVIHAILRLESADNGSTGPEFGIMMSIVVLFDAAATCMAFAGESEERTAWLLRMLPVRTPNLMSAKLVGVATGSFSLFAAMIVFDLAFAWLLNLLRPIFPSLPPQQSLSLTAFPGVSGVWPFACANMLLVMAASVLASMTSGKLMAAVGKTAAICFGFNILLFWALHSLVGIRSELPEVFIALLATASFLLFLVSVVFLPRPWHLGRLPARRSVSESALKTLQHSVPASSGLSSLNARFWHGWLLRAGDAPASQRRLMCILAWREARSAVPFLLIWLPAGLAVCIGQYFPSFFYPWTILFLLVFIFECGQQTMREDQRTGSLTMLANIGVSPTRIWFTKTVFWLTLMVGVGAVFVAMNEFVLMSPAAQQHRKDIESLLGQVQAIDFRVTQLIDLIRVRSLYSQYGDMKSPSTPADRWLQAGFCLSGILWLFAAGQLTVCWIRRQILAFFSGAFLVSVGLFVVLPQIAVHDWPVWLSAVPIPFCMMLAAAATSRRWVDRTVSRSLRLQQMSWLILPLVVFPLLGWNSWRNAPARVSAWLERNSTGMSSSGALNSGTDIPETKENEQLAKAMSMRPSEWSSLDDPADAQFWYEFAEATRKFPVHKELLKSAPNSNYSYLGTAAPRMLSEWRPRDRKPADIRNLLQPFDSVMKQDRPWPALPILWTAPWTKTPVAAVVALLLEDARYMESQGDAPEAVRQIVRAIHVSRSLAAQTSTWANFICCCDAERVALGRLRIVLGTADLSGIDLDAIYVELKTTLVVSSDASAVNLKFPDPRPMLTRRLHFASLMARFQGQEALVHDLVETVEKNRGVDNDVDRDEPRLNKLLSATNALGSIGMQRAVESMTLCDSLLSSRIENMDIEGRMPLSSRSRAGFEVEAVRQLDRLLATSSLGDMVLDLTLLQQDTPAFPSVIDTVASERATLLTILLQKHRLTHGAFPDSLLDLEDRSTGWAAIQTDPWTGGPFFYSAKGLSQRLRIDAGFIGTFINPGQPVLISAGFAGTGLQDALKLPAGFESDRLNRKRLPPHLVVFLGGPDPADWLLERL